MKKVAWEKITEFEGPEHSPGFLLWQTSTAWRREIEMALIPLDLTHPQFVLLANLGWLTRLGEAVSQVELARQCKTDITMTSQVLRTLEKKGFIERRKQTGNEKSKFPFLTASGAKLLEKAIPCVEEVDRAFFAPLKQAIPTFVKILQKLNEDSHSSFF